MLSPNARSVTKSDSEADSRERAGTDHVPFGHRVRQSADPEANGEQGGDRDPDRLAEHESEDHTPCDRLRHDVTELAGGHSDARVGECEHWHDDECRPGMQPELEPFHDRHRLLGMT